MVVVKKALVEIKTGIVKNIISIEEDSKWTPPKGHYLIDKDCSIGDVYNGKIIPQVSKQIDWVKEYAESKDKTDVIARYLGLL